MKFFMAVIALGVLLVGCGKKPAVVTKSKPKEPTQVEKPLPKDFESLKALAEKGDARAQYDLGVMYEKGKGVPEDDKEAVKWYRMAADQGLARAQNNLGNRYHLGQGVEKNFVTAYAWHTLAATNGDAVAKENKSELTKKMTPDQIAKAEALVKEMTAKNPKLLNK